MGTWYTINLSLIELAISFVVIKCLFVHSTTKCYHPICFTGKLNLTREKKVKHCFRIFKMIYIGYDEKIGYVSLYAFFNSAGGSVHFQYININSAYLNHSYIFFIHRPLKPNVFLFNFFWVFTKCPKKTQKP